MDMFGVARPSPLCAVPLPDRGPDLHRVEASQMRVGVQHVSLVSFLPLTME